MPILEIKGLTGVALQRCKGIRRDRYVRLDGLHPLMFGWERTENAVGHL